VLGEPAQVREAARTIIEATGGRGLILSSGCALGRNTKPENMEALVSAAEEFGTLAGRG
jgi:uroporphyrinogen-III decarboxylase